MSKSFFVPLFFFFLIQAAVKKVQSYYWQPCEFWHVFLTWTSLLLHRQPGHPHFRQVTILMSKLVWPPVGIDHSQKPESWAQWILLPQPPKSNYDSSPQMILYSVTGIIIRQNIENIKLQCQSKIPEAFYDRCHYHLPEILIFSVICSPFLSFQDYLYFLKFFRRLTDFPFICHCALLLGIVVVVQTLRRVRLFASPWTAACQLPCHSLSPGVSSNSCPLSWWWHPTISSSVIPFSSCPQPFPASESLPIGWLFTSGGQSIGASAGHNSCCIGQRFCTLHVLEFFIAREWAHQADLFITTLFTFRSMICCSKCHFFFRWNCGEKVPQ